MARKQGTNPKGESTVNQATELELDSMKGFSGTAAYARASGRSIGNFVPDSEHRIAITVHSDLVDRWEGLSTTVGVWGLEPNLRFITEALTDETIRRNVADFFARRKFATTFKKLLPGISKSSRTIRPNEGLLDKSDIHEVLMADFDAVEAGVIMELVLPTLLDLGLVSKNIKYSRHVRYPMKRVTAAAIQHDVAMYQVTQAVKSAKSSSVDREGRYTVSVLAEMLAEALRPIGIALYEYHDLSSIIDDIVKGVRAHLDPTLSDGSLTGNVSSDWRNHSVVTELAQNMVFIRAALEIPPRTNVAPSSEGWKLNQWAPTILAALKSSERYAWVSKAEVLRTYGLNKIRDVKGKPVSAVLYRNAKVQPTAQAVFALEDDVMAGSYYIHATRDRIADAIQSAYGSADFNTADGATLISNLLTDAVEAGWEGSRALYICDMWGAGIDIVTAACMMSDRLYVNASTKGVELTDYTVKAAEAGKENDAWEAKWWFSVKTQELALDVLSGSHLRSDIITSDPVEAILAYSAFSPLDLVPVKPQVLGPAAFNTAVVAFDENILRSVSKRYAFRVEVNGVVMQGSFKPASFASMRSRELTSLVLPHFNESVIYGYASAYTAANYMLQAMQKTYTNDDDTLGEVGAVLAQGWREQSAPGSEFFSLMKRRIARSLLQLAQKLSPAFRNEVHEAIIARSTGADNLSIEDSMKLRAKLTQRTFAAACDMIALDFFLDTQGITIDVWREMMNDAEMVKVWMETGTDRELAFD